jgi:hypothetical protein
MYEGAVLWVVTLCSVLQIYQRFAVSRRLHLQTKRGDNRFVQKSVNPYQSTRSHNPEDSRFVRLLRNVVTYTKFPTPSFAVY